ncbi:MULTISPECIES: prolyl aminopeptidase [unclassified Mycoplasma]|uniref:prolyl aminopeptidase n=1 Tax=unclassified Mycoplasma TaxID=2683645 RepID=UPI00216B49D9|nr:MULTISPECIES: prolyl aminopeptidase [unclassified Mycoplasma]MCS4536803.1 prolyl aminopeptidase [Mycoplasma sp. CSL7475-4]MCT4469911.1 prolyl aminopeptidase [Mycoplasma sp. HS2188]
MTYLKYLYPEIKPYLQDFYSPNDSEHQIYYEVSGNPDGIPVVYVHGGPGGGTSPVCRRYFDPKKYMIILIDQRGCGNSTPSLLTKNNTTDFLVQDMENIRKLLKIDKWILFGGSWGTTLSLCYAIKYPRNVLRMVLRGVYLNRQSDIDWLYQEGASYLKPIEYEQYISILNDNERKDIVSAYYHRMNTDDENTRKQAYIEWAKWENALISVNKINIDVESDMKSTAEISYLENYYFYNKGFMSENYILHNIDKIKDIETYIVHGEYDLDCRPSGAYELHKALNNSHLFMLTKTAHTQREWKISKTLIKIMQNIAF